MIDIKKTIFSSIINKLNQLRFQAKDNPKEFRSILELIILDDVIEWTGNTQLPEGLLDKLMEKRIQLILCNSAFTPEYIDSETTYVNVNTPQTSSTWQRVWDSDCIRLPESSILTELESLETSEGSLHLIEVFPGGIKSLTEIPN